MIGLIYGCFVGLVYVFGVGLLFVGWGMFLDFEVFLLVNCVIDVIELFGIGLCMMVDVLKLVMMFDEKVVIGSVLVCEFIGCGKFVVFDFICIVDEWFDFLLLFDVD